MRRLKNRLIEDKHVANYYCSSLLMLLLIEQHLPCGLWHWLIVLAFHFVWHSIKSTLKIYRHPATAVNPQHT